jgi:predicted Rossmann fold flavoprotein
MTNINLDYEVIVVGGGAAGMIAAWRSASLGAKTLLVEKNKTLGAKVRISGGGKCNITHSGGLEDLLKGYRKNESHFLKPSLYKFSNKDIINLLERRGVKTYERTDGKVFPISNDAKDVVEAMKSNLHNAGVDIKMNSTVEDILTVDQKITGIKVDGKIISAPAIIIATGGLSYPKTGTTGDGFKWLGKVGHTIIPLRPALAPMKIEPEYPHEWSGVAIRECMVYYSVGGQIQKGWRGDLLFTHEGISGPAVLEISRDAAEALANDTVNIVLDTQPDVSTKQLDEIIRQIFLSNPNKEIKNISKQFLPSRVVDYLLERHGLEPEKRCSVLTRDSRMKLMKIIKELVLGKVVEIDIERGEVTAGGVSLKEVDRKTMHSRIISGLYLCGEVLDIAGHIGGYNLQAAYSTGYLAGESSVLLKKNPDL